MSSLEEVFHSSSMTMVSVLPCIAVLMELDCRQKSGPFGAAAGWNAVRRGTR